ncbi:MAG TPA: alginate lyase family protein [Dinghuibacter sp.]|uniref:alginate lyase family protein n=1 Tax=Dinghuibacter sp. TaxID=2024697 RepID=UPI002CAB7DD9|nr:alginate lyase family protein [Dinghuibacter sp.]HTJ13455.1 alginate lyase family protein [Dinghuibacter sp.]
MKRTLFAILSCCAAVCEGRAQMQLLSKSDIVKIDPAVLQTHRRRPDEAAIRRLKAEGDGLLSWGPVSVMQKDGMPPSGDKHDYMSIAPYFWPDPSKPGGLPYINRDGDVNPEVKQYQDKDHIVDLCSNVYTLGLAWYFTRDEKYAKKAAELVRVWFLDTATRMNPNLNYGQAVKGVTPGRQYGLIETRNFIFLIDGLDLLQTSRSFTAADHAALQGWFKTFRTWMYTNPLGVAEMHGGNNHSVWFDAQDLSMALYVGDTSDARRIIARAEGRLDTQMNTDGLFPEELKRTTSLHYSVFILNAFYVIAQLSEGLGTDFWTLKTAGGKTLRQAFDALQPYIEQTKEWTGPQIHPFNFHDAVPILLRSRQHYGCQTCGDAIKKITDDPMIDLL